MLPSVIGLLLFILLIVILGIVFAATVFDIAINGVILCLIAIRAWAELRKSRVNEYAIAGFIALAVFFIKAKIFAYFWPVTNFVIVWFVLAQVAHLLVRLGRKTKRRR